MYKLGIPLLALFLLLLPRFVLTPTMVYLPIAILFLHGPLIHANVDPLACTEIPYPSRLRYLTLYALYLYGL